MAYKLPHIVLPSSDNYLMVIDRNKEQTDLAVSYFYRQLMQTGVERVEPAKLTLNDDDGKT